jgi:hypothetical protein
LGRADAGRLPERQIGAFEEPMLRQRELVDEAMRCRHGAMLSQIISPVNEFADHLRIPLDPPDERILHM